MKRSGLKYDEGKTPLEFVPIEALIEEFPEVPWGSSFLELAYWCISASGSRVSLCEFIAPVLAFGAAKYEVESWRTVLPVARYLGAARRHCIEAARHGMTSRDAESDLLVLAHAACDFTFLHIQCTLKGQPLHAPGLKYATV